ncbi:hypothetical protein [Pedobacter sp. SYSU D00535]|uniref:hypothetical protein n=1 Tax=Pedobacter sp. SYSU D00535 TaxID=2810308 RepID=UPI001A96CD7B|nr:hypothetical protein [Pedobacter sp. SYSU D00535]
MEGQNDLNVPANNGRPFYIEAAINEEGPKKLLVESGADANEYYVYHEEKLISRLRLSGNDEWEQLEGGLTPGITHMLGRAISRLSH